MADILIKGLALPKKGEVMKLYLCSDGDVGFSEDGKPYKTTAIELPEHGRLTDADALSNRLLGEGIGNLLIHRKQRLTVGDVRTILENAPTIVEASI